MGSIENTVHYCCVSKSNRILYAYSGGNHEIENLAVLCLEKTPPFHRRYFETVDKRTYGFLIEDGYVYFVIVDEGLGNAGVVQFLEHLRGSFSGMNGIGIGNGIQEQELITSLENVCQSRNNWMGESPLSASNVNGSCTEAPLLGKKAKDHVIGVRDGELETDRGMRVDCDKESGGGGCSISELGSLSSQDIDKKKWWRQVRIILAIDGAVCLILFVVWLCIR